ncbi:MAG: hypothetical protein I8H77_17025 [Comamonadaceae bacterium]|nr:hypothetical protein [Comamonadaceae bacterium]
MPSKRIPMAGTAAVLVALVACAPMVPSAPAQLQQSVGPAKTIEVQLPAAVPVHLSTGYARTLPAQSRWRLSGRVPQGDVYQPVGAVFSIEGRQVHEAYLVVQKDVLVGFYLPAESRFSPLEPTINLPKGVFP